jgi:hypothetical protein
MQTREETNTDASLRNTPLAVPLATERNPSQTRMSQDLFPREVLREPQQYSMPMSQLGQEVPRIYPIDPTALAYAGEICALDNEVRSRRLSGLDLLNGSISGCNPLRAN